MGVIKVSKSEEETREVVYKVSEEMEYQKAGAQGLTAIFSLLGMDGKGQRCKLNCVAHARVRFCDRWGTIGTYIVVQLIPI